MAAPKSTAADIEKWHKIISDGEASEMSAKEYCEKHDINTKTYSAWKKRLKEMGKELPESKTPSAPKKGRAARSKSSAAKKPSKVSSITPHFGKKTEPKVDLANYVISATLPNGVGLEVKCASDKEFDKALEKLSHLKP